MRDIKLICSFLLLVFVAQAQHDSLLAKQSTPRNLRKLGKNALQQNDPASAVTFYEAYFKTPGSGTDVKSMQQLGFAYLETRDYEKAQRIFLRAYNKNKEKVPEALYFHALMQKSNGLYDSAGINFQKFRKEYKGKDKTMKRQAAREVVFCDSVQKIIQSEHKIVIMHLDSAINKVNTEAAPANLDANTLVFTSLRTDKVEYIIEDDTASAIKKKLYYATRKNDKNEWEFKGEFGSEFNDPAFNISSASFSPDKKRMYFTRCRPNIFEKMICAIYMSEKKEGGWSEPVKLPKIINDPKYNSTMPAVTSDPVKGNDILYYVTNKKTGKGRMDIWYTVYDKKRKTFKAPRNAGSRINTSGNEISPFFDTETRTLYYSSDGQGGLGGYDIYKATGDGKKWTLVENIGQPINTGADDIYYTISANREEGFFVSNRKGGNSLKHSTCCDDIYYYKHSGYIRLELKGKVRDAVDATVVIPHALIEVYIKDKTNGDKFLVKTIESDSLGSFGTSLEANHEYFLVVKKEDFLGTSADVSTLGKTYSDTLGQDMQLVRKPKEPIRIPNLQYEFNSAKIIDSTKPLLDSLVVRLMIDNPELIIEIQSHTDSKGSDAFNLKLSQRRAESVVKYLVSKGIAVERLRAKGYGETKPVAPNENPDGSDNPDGRAKNRRTDFKIIGTIDAEIINDAKVE